MPTPTLDLTDPNHPTFSYRSGGDIVDGGLQCNCQPSDSACLERCENRAQTLLDASLEVLPADP
jgi:hypothetical protein